MENSTLPTTSGAETAAFPASPFSIVTWNVNGIRARERDAVALLDQHRPDILALQEVKATQEQIPAPLGEHPDYWGYWHGYKGYSGVSLLFSRARFPVRPEFTHPDFDHESRIVTARADGTVFASIYVPNGGKDFPAKVRFLDALAEFVRALRARGESVVLLGDLNVAREPRDVHPTLRRPMQIGQTPEEQAQLEEVIGTYGAETNRLTDLLRHYAPDDDRLFTWWAPWRNMRQKNIGWRLDYVLSSPELTARAQGCTVLREFGTSDHAPVLATFGQG